MTVEVSTNPVRRENVSLPATVVPGSGGADMLTVDVRFLTRLFIHLTVATASLTGFKIKGTATGADAAPATIFSATADYTTNAGKGLMLGASGDLTGQAAGSGWMAMDVGPFQTIVISATSGGTATLALEVGGT